MLANNVPKLFVGIFQHKPNFGSGLEMHTKGHLVQEENNNNRNYHYCCCSYCRTGGYQDKKIGGKIKGLTFLPLFKGKLKENLRKNKENTRK